jgi:hypothetical protein
MTGDKLRELLASPYTAVDTDNPLIDEFEDKVIFALSIMPDELLVHNARLIVAMLTSRMIDDTNTVSMEVVEHVMKEVLQLMLKSIESGQLYERGERAN